MANKNKKTKKTKSPGGSGRGMKGVIVNDEMERPECHNCGSFMRSNGKRDWACTNCPTTIVKIRKDAGIKEYNDSLGFDADTAIAYAKKCEKGRRVILTDRKSTRLNSSHRCISYAVFCLKKKKTYKYKYR